MFLGVENKVVLVFFCVGVVGRGVGASLCESAFAVFVFGIFSEECFRLIYLLVVVFVGFFFVVVRGVVTMGWRVVWVSWVFLGEIFDVWGLVGCFFFGWGSWGV